MTSTRRNGSRLEGEPTLENIFLEMMGSPGSNSPRLATNYFNKGLAGRIAFSPKFYRAVGVDPAIGKAAESGSPRPQIPEALRKQLAASVQQACGKIAAEIAERYRKQTGAKSLCLAGGLFLNPVIVSHVEKNTGFDEVFVQPAAGNEGTALGAAWYVRHHYAKEILVRLRWRNSIGGRATPIRKSSRCWTIARRATVFT